MPIFRDPGYYQLLKLWIPVQYMYVLLIFQGRGTVLLVEPSSSRTRGWARTRANEKTWTSPAPSTPGKSVWTAQSKTEQKSTELTPGIRTGFATSTAPINSSSSTLSQPPAKDRCTTWRHAVSRLALNCLCFTDKSTRDDWIFLKWKFRES